MKISRLAILGFGFGMGILASILLLIGASLQYLYLVMGILIGSAVVPITLAILWKKANKYAATWEYCWTGLWCGCLVNIASMLYGEITMSSTGQNAPLLIGNLSAISIGGVVSIVGSIAKPENFNFEVMKQRILVVDSKIRLRIEQDTDESFLKNAAQLSYRVCYCPYLYTCYSLATSPLPIWICFFTVCLLCLDWDCDHVGCRSELIVIIALPLIEARKAILEVIRRITTFSFSKNISEGDSFDYASGGKEYQTAISKHVHRFKKAENYDIRKMLVVIDGSKEAWTWAATLLQSSTVAFQYGVSGPFWYAAGASIQVLLFGILAIELKRKAPNAHTFLEIIRARFGEGTHRVFLVFALMTNMIVTAMLLLGGASSSKWVNRNEHLNSGVSDTCRSNDLYSCRGIESDFRCRLFAYHNNFHHDSDFRVCCLFYQSGYRGSTGDVREASRWQQVCILLMETRQVHILLWHLWAD